ncbi:MAG: PQQ-binding-like beta-propeller repeat protein [Roseibacillus sp.]
MKQLPLVLLAVLSAGGLPAAESWPQFRGPDGSATAPEGAKIPVEWSESRNLRWKTAIPGPGSSSPVFTGNRLFVTCYTGYGTSREEAGSAKDLGRQLLCLDRTNGKILWKKAIEVANPEDPFRGFLMEHGYASSTPVTDGERVYVFAGKSGLHAFTVEGKRLWTKEVGNKSSNRRWGSGASPVLYRNLVIINAADEARSLIAFDKSSGDEKWRYGSKELELAFATPQFLVAGDGRDEMVLSIPHELFALDPATGKRKWLARTKVPGNVSPSVVITGDMICAFGGYPRKMSIGLKRGGSGDVTGNLQWDSKVTTYVPTPLAYGNHLYWVNDSAEAIRMEIATGKVVSKKMVEGLARSKKFSFYASMVRVGDRLYAVSRHNGTFVFEANAEMEQIAQNKFKDRSDFSGTPALARDALYLRSGKFVYCVGE